MLLVYRRLMREADWLVDKCMFLNVLLATTNPDVLSSYAALFLSSPNCLSVLVVDVLSTYHILALSLFDVQS